MMSINNVLERTAAEFALGNGRVGSALANLMADLNLLRSRQTLDDWRNLSQDIALRHPVNDLLRQDPFTRRAFEKPRGYAGDAVMIDYIYGCTSSNGATSLGKTILEHIRDTDLAHAVRWRRDTLAGAIDRVASARRAPRVLALAAGHLREGHISTALPAGRVGELIALDHDPESLAVVEREFGRFGVKLMQASVLDLVLEDPPPPSLEEAGAGEGFDLIYAAGLYDYLWQGAAEQLTAWAFRRLRPGGRLLIANVLPELPEAGYMEAITDWWLVHRTEEQLAGVADQIPRAEVQTRRVFKDDRNCVAFLDLIRV